MHHSPRNATAYALYRSKAALLFWIILLFKFRVCHAFLSVHCSLVVTCGERANLLALLYVMFSWVLSLVSHLITPDPGHQIRKHHMRCGGLDQVWYLIELIPDLCLLTYFGTPNGRKGELLGMMVLFIYIN